MCSGKSGSNVLMIDLVCSFHVLIALSAAFCLWIDGGTIWNFTVFFVMFFCKAFTMSAIGLMTKDSNSRCKVHHHCTNHANVKTETSQTLIKISGISTSSTSQTRDFALSFNLRLTGGPNSKF